MGLPSRASGLFSADALGVPVETVSFDLGDSRFPHAPVAGGSNSTAMVGQAIHEAAKVVHGKLAALAVADAASPLLAHERPVRPWWQDV